EKAVKTALKEPERIDYNLVDSQQARRILDRIVGYKLSPFVRTRVKDAESAGRVQSVAVRLAVELENKINNFVPEEYWYVCANLVTPDGTNLKVVLNDKDGKKFRPSNKKEALDVENACKNNSFVVKSVKKGVSKSHALPPFTTSTMQQDASNKLGLSAPQVMQLAQHLYEGMETARGHLALVTYIRTDSTRVSFDAQNEALSFIKDKFGDEYCPKKPNIYTTKKNAQDAHEAIRPIDVKVTPESVKDILDKNHYRLYKLIYERYLASQMAEAQYYSMQILVNAGDYGFKASGKSVKFKGYTAVYDYVAGKTDEDGEVDKLLPDMNEGDVLKLSTDEKLNKTGNPVLEQKYTKPPVRYTDSTLVKAIEENGIGRPSTYATIIGTLTKHKYIEREGKYLKPTNIAFDATEILVKYFEDVMDVGFTAKMETKLDSIAEGNQNWRSVVSSFYKPFIKELQIASSDNGEETQFKCENCGANYYLKHGRFGDFLSCPICKKTKNPTDKVSEIKCPNCNELMVEKDGKFGKYLACDKCNTRMQDGDEVSAEKCSCGSAMINKSGKFGKYLKCTKCGKTKSLTERVGVCPKCHKPAQKMINKNGKVFYGCSGYPNCNFVSWEIPTGDLCPTCGQYLYEKEGKIRCSDKKCNYAISVKEKK
ncbi:MAG: type I DNA topoisomerase, partial [Clostridia bacterium]|nr:type I DNA topoisomerase [Clostridia bacterium]